MKKLLLTIFISSLFIACTKKGEIIESPKDFIIIHGKTYKFDISKR